MSTKIKYGGYPVKIEPLKYNIKKAKINNPALDRAKEVVAALKEYQKQ